MVMFVSLFASGLFLHFGDASVLGGDALTGSVSDGSVVNENEIEIIIPSKYSLIEEGYATPVKNQYMGTCWACAATISMESSYKVRYGEVIDIDPVEIAKKAKELGAKVITLSGPDGYIYDPAGVSTDEKVNYLLTMRSSGRNKVEDYAKKFKGVKFYPGKKPWGVKADVIMPAATQNDVKIESARLIVKNKIKYYVEVANMPTTNDALQFLMKSKVTVAPSKAVNAGGVSVSALEMSQNSERLVWSAKEVDEKLHQIMINIYENSVAAAKKYGFGYNLVAGANLAGFQKVADAMMAQGVF